jgi:hypothetical protein
MFRSSAAGLLLALALVAPADAQVIWLPAPRPVPEAPEPGDPRQPWQLDGEAPPVAPWRPVPLAHPTTSLEVRLYHAVARGDAAAVKQLVEQGARVESRDRAGMSPLAWAAQRGRTAIASYLITRRVNLNPQDHHGFTPLMWAAQEGHAGVVEVLLRAGANPRVRTRHGVTALWLARWARHAPTVALLESRLTGRAPLPPLRPRSVVSVTATPTPTPAPPASPVPAAVASQPPTPAPSSAPGAREQALLRLGQSAVEFQGEYQAYLVANPATGLAFLGPGGGVDDQVGTLMTRFYATLARSQDLGAARADLEQAKVVLGANRQSRFARFVVEADQALLAAGV